jgi:hypothetical protein
MLHRWESQLAFPSPCFSISKSNSVWSDRYPTLGDPIRINCPMDARDLFENDPSSVGHQTRIWILKENLSLI